MHDEHLAPRGGTGPTPASRPWYRRATPLACTAAGLALVGMLIAGVPFAAAGAALPDASPATPLTSAMTLQAFPAAGSSTADRVPRSTRGTARTVTAQTPARAADADESTGVVLIDTVLGYEDASAAGTGMVLTNDGLVLTNNHVVEGSTSIRVTIASTGQAYTASVVGTDATDDVALLRLQGASGLSTVKIDDDAEQVGDAVTAVGNASGRGALVAAAGQITALQSTVTTAAENSIAGETLNGMIQISADVVSGDSGGALRDAEGEVVGMTTAASSGTAVTTAYAIPIEKALAIVDRIQKGDTTGGIVLGYPAFLGVAQATSASLGPSTRTGATVGDVIDGTPAASAGLRPGDTLTSVGGVAVTGWKALSTAIGAHKPGDTVSLSWTDRAGESHTTDTRLVAGPVA